MKRYLTGLWNDDVTFPFFLKCTSVGFIHENIEKKKKGAPLFTHLTYKFWNINQLEILLSYKFT